MVLRMVLRMVLLLLMMILMTTSTVLRMSLRMSLRMFWMFFVAGPLTPLQEQQGGLRFVYRKRLCGDVEVAHLSRSAFDAEYHKFSSIGVAADPSDGAAAAAAAAAESVEAPLRLAEFTPLPMHRDTSSSSSSNGKLSRKERRSQRPARNTDVESDQFQGPWALYVSPSAAGADAAAAAAAASGEAATAAAEREAEAAANGETTEPEAAAATENEATKEEETEETDTSKQSAASAAAAATKRGDSILHVKQRMDYQGRSWIAAPTHLKPLAPDASFFVPRQCVHTFVGHTGGVQAVRLFPETAHLLLSASLDSTVKLWDVYNQRRCLCTYTAHQQAVRDIQWADQGKHFYSCGYDNKVRLWDTEQGKVISTFSNKKTPYCIAVYPSDWNIFITGCSNRRAVQFDARSGDVIVEYADHLGAVNTVSFAENGKKIITTADDKKMFIWEFGIPVVIKHIADPEMHAMPACSTHPSGRYISFQAMNNEIVTYEANNKFRFLPKKKYRGHLSAGYAIQPAFSPDGKYLLSGDATGRLFAWDFKTGRTIRTLKAHSKVCMGAQWHPHAQSRVFTCGWDGLIKLWD